MQVLKRGSPFRQRVLQIEAQVMKVGMIAEATCAAKPLTIIPMVVTEIQDVIASGQVRTTDQLVDVTQLARPGTITVYLEPLWPGALDGIPPGSSCIANAYTNNHDALAAPDISTGRNTKSDVRYTHAVPTAITNPRLCSP